MVILLLEYISYITYTIIFFYIWLKNCYSSLKRVQMGICIYVRTCVILPKLKSGKYRQYFRPFISSRESKQRHCAMKDNSIFRKRKRFMIWGHLYQYLTFHRLNGDFKEICKIHETLKNVIFMRTNLSQDVSFPRVFWIAKVSLNPKQTVI